MACHFLGLCHFIPLGNILGPLILWLLKREDSSYINYHGKEALNFQLSVTLYALVCVILTLVLIGVFLLIALGIYAIVMSILAGIKAQEGVQYRYPLTIRFIR